MEFLLLSLLGHSLCAQSDSGSISFWMIWVARGPLGFVFFSISIQVIRYSIGVLQSGQFWDRVTRSVMHVTWNSCPHDCKVSFLINKSRHIVQSPISVLFRILLITGRLSQNSCSAIISITILVSVKDAQSDHYASKYFCVCFVTTAISWDVRTQPANSIHV
jgi:hypothetical protein